MSLNIAYNAVFLSETRLRGLRRVAAPRRAAGDYFAEGFGWLRRGAWAGVRGRALGAYGRGRKSIGKGEKKMGTMDQDILKVLYTEKQIAARIEAMGMEMYEDLKDKNPLFVSVLRGAFIFMADKIGRAHV